MSPATACPPLPTGPEDLWQWHCHCLLRCWGRCSDWVCTPHWQALQGVQVHTGRGGSCLCRQGGDTCRPYGVFRCTRGGEGGCCIWAHTLLHQQQSRQVVVQPLGSVALMDHEQGPSLLMSSSTAGAWQLAALCHGELSHHRSWVYGSLKIKPAEKSSSIYLAFHTAFHIGQKVDGYGEIISVLTMMIRSKGLMLWW